jgi:hypothetical protein
LREGSYAFLGERELVVVVVRVDGTLGGQVIAQVIG